MHPKELEAYKKLLQLYNSYGKLFFFNFLLVPNFFHITTPR